MILPYPSCAEAAAGSSKVRNERSSKKLVSFFFIIVLRSLNERFVSTESKKRTQPSAGCTMQGVALPALRFILAAKACGNAMIASRLFHFVFRNVRRGLRRGVGWRFFRSRVGRKAIRVMAFAALIDLQLGGLLISAVCVGLPQLVCGFV